MAIKLDEARIRRLSTNGVTTIAGGHIYLTGSQAGSSTGNTTQLVFGTSSSNHVVLSSNDNALVINPTTSSTTNQIVLYLNQKSKFPSGVDAGTGGITTTGAISASGNISGNYIQGTWLYTSAATAQTTTSKIAVIHSDNYIYYITPANLTTLIKNNASGTWSISISGNAATATAATKLSHNDSFALGEHRFQYFDINGTAGAAKEVNDTPTTAWWHIIRLTHANTSGYYTDVAIPFNDNSIYYKRIKGGAVQNWVKVLDSLNYSSYALPISGGTMNSGSQILRASSSQSWVNGRKGALLAHAYASANRFTSNQYNPLWSAKSINGSWDCGTYTANNNLYFTYITDTNFDAGTNTTTQQVIIGGNDGKITASGFIGNLSGNAATASQVNGVIPEWSGSIAWADTSWIAAWNGDGTKIKALAKSSFAAAGHTHSYAGSSSAGGAAHSANKLNINNSAGLADCLQYIQTSSQTAGNDLPSAAWHHVIKMNHGNGDTYYKRLLAFDFWGQNNVYTTTAEGNGTVKAWKKFWIEGDSVTGAVWNDYAEYRESDCKEFGRVLAEKGDDTLTKTTKRLQPFAGVSSDTWGFCQGETEKAKTPIAVAGRVLVYTYRNRKEYKPGDAVCAAPNGTVDIMTREEIIKYPDRIVGTVSCVPEYETWGSGDRDPVKVGNRIWIKVN